MLRRFTNDARATSDDTRHEVFRRSGILQRLVSVFGDLHRCRNLLLGEHMDAGAVARADIQALRIGPIADSNRLVARFVCDDILSGSCGCHSG